MPCDYKQYPENWLTEIRPAKLEQAGHRCEQCGVENYELHPITGSRVVLTIAHLDHDVQNNNDENLKALCQRCHLGLDARQHARNAAITRRRKKERAGQLRLAI